MTVPLWIIVGIGIGLVLVVCVLRFLHCAAEYDEKMRHVMEEEYCKRYKKEE